MRMKHNREEEEKKKIAIPHRGIFMQQNLTLPPISKKKGGKKGENKKVEISVSYTDYTFTV